MRSCSNSPAKRTRLGDLRHLDRSSPQRRSAASGAPPGWASQNRLRLCGNHFEFTGKGYARPVPVLRVQSRSRCSAVRRLDRSPTSRSELTIGGLPRRAARQDGSEQQKPDRGQHAKARGRDGAGYAHRREGKKRRGAPGHRRTAGVGARRAGARQISRGHQSRASAGD
jgi:hypothetical protein